MNVINFGAIGDGVMTNTAAIQNAINAAATGGTTNGLNSGSPWVDVAGSSTVTNVVIPFNQDPHGVFYRMSLQP